MKLNIKHRVLLWGLFSSGLAFLFAGAIFLYSMAGARDAIAEQGAALGDSVAESAGHLAEQNAMERLRESAALKARHIDRELTMTAQDTEYLANAISMILASPERYLPRTLPSTGDGVRLLSGVPYIHYSPTLRAEGIDGELAEEIATAANFADTLALMSGGYTGYTTCFYAASRKGYMIYLDIHPDGEGSSLLGGEAREEMLSGFDPRERAWYKKGEKAAGAVFSKTYTGMDGHLNVDCVAPYYDAEGFAGVVGIGCDVEEGYRQIAHALSDPSGVNFIMDGDGDVVFSSRTTGILAEVPALVDIRKAGERDLAAAARRMAAGESGTAPVSVDGEMHYLAYAPMKTIGWSYGTLMRQEEVMAPSVEVREDVFASMSGFRSVLKDIFAGSTRNAVLAFVAAAAFLAVGSQKLAARITNPILRLAEGVREISGGNLGRKLDIKTGDEIELLSESFNRMTGELSAYMRDLARTTAEKERIATELDLARRIQEGMLPKDFPERREFGIFATMHPAKEVGGDFYDFYFLDETHLAVTVADVSDKGVPAALFMVNAKTLLKENVIALKDPERLSEAAARTNDTLSGGNEEEMFVTVFCGVLDIATGEFLYANAGHNPPLLRRGAGFSYFPKGGSLMMGIMEGETFPAKRVSLAPGDALFLYTDGVTEAMDESGEMFREERLRAALCATPPATDAPGLVGAVRDALRAYVGEAEQSDDITMLALVYRGNHIDTKSTEE